MRIVTAVLFAAAVAPPVIAQTTPDSVRSAPAPKHALLNSYIVARRQLTAAADTMPADAYAVRQAADIKSFAEVIGHVVETNFGVCAGIRGETNPKKGQRFDGVITAKTELVSALKDSFSYCDVPMNALTVGTMGGSDVTFLVTHTSQMIVMADFYLATRGIFSKSNEVARTRIQ